MTVNNDSLSTNDLREIDAYDLLDLLGMDTAPFEPFDVAKRLGIEVDQSLTFENIKQSGSITSHNGRVNIWINPLDSRARQNFTLAHEIGHYVNDILTGEASEIKDTPTTLYRSGESDFREVRANNFAAKLLMPKDSIVAEARILIEAQPRKSMGTFEFIEKMASKFDVSKPAMLVRLKVLKMVEQDYRL